MFLLGFMICALANAQVRRVTGQVTSAETGDPLLGVSVHVKGTTVGVNTDADGKFTLNNVPASAKIIRFSFIGLKTQELPIKGGVMNVQLESNDKVLKGAVVTALGIRRDAKALGYAATDIKADEITANRSSDIMGGLQGKVAGLQISSVSGDPGTSKSVVIRGFSSLAGSNQPLFVIDGVPMENNTVNSGDELNHNYDFGNGANAINPDDVADISVLKGAAATALYGSRAANGVIMITTKKGTKRKKGIGVTYNGGIQLSYVARLPQFQNSFGQGVAGVYNPNENTNWGPLFDGIQRPYGYVYENSQRVKSYSAVKDNIRDFFDHGVEYNNSISFDGATDNSDYFVSLSNINNNGIYPGNADKYNKYTFSARGSYSLNNLKFSSTLNYSYNKNSFVSTGQRLSPMFSIINTPRNISLKEMADLNNPFNTPGYYFTPYNATNPYYILRNYLDTYEQDKLYGKFQVDYEFLKYFRFTYRIGMDYTHGFQRSGIPNLKALYGDDPCGLENSDVSGQQGYYMENKVTRRQIDQDLMLNFDKQLATDWHLNALVGMNFNERRTSQLAVSVSSLDIPNWFNLSNSGSTPTLTSYQMKRHLMGLYGQAEGSWKEQVFVTYSARNDWSSTLPKKERSYFYQGITGSWVFSELLPKDWKDYVSFGKFRIAWGKTGNDASPYLTETVYAQAAASASGFGETDFPLNGQNAYSLSNSMGNNKLKPEMTTETEFGLNMAFLHNRVSFDLAWYLRHTKNQVLNMTIDPAVGFTSRSINTGEIDNKGVELAVNVTPIKTRDWQWDVNWTFSTNHSKVVSLPDEIGKELMIYGFTNGTGLYATVGKPLGVFKVNKFERDPQGHIVVNASTGLPVRATSQDYSGDINNKYTMGLGTKLTWKSLSLAANLDIRKGGKMYSRTKNSMYFCGNAIQTAYNDRNTFIVPNSVNKITDAAGNVTYQTNATPVDFQDMQTFWNDYSFDDALDLISRSYVKLRSVVITWALPSKWLEKTPLTGVSISAFGNNLITWTPDSNTFVDPESTSFGNDLTGSFGEYMTNPSTRTFGFNVNVSF